MKQYRVTKYNPEYRDKAGTYQKDEWTDYADIGNSFSGCILTQEEYGRVENNYIMICIDVWKRQGRPALLVKDIENHCYLDVPKVINDENRLSQIIREILENKLWARLIGDNFFIHFGWDFYMYIGTQLEQSAMTELASSHNLYSEEMDSPYSLDR